MSKKKAHVEVALQEKRNKRWKFLIDLPGPPEKQTKDNDYSTRQLARKGAIRQLGATPAEGGGYTATHRGKTYQVVFTTLKAKR